MSGKPASKTTTKAPKTQTSSLKKAIAKSAKRTSVEGQRKSSVVTDNKDSVACWRDRYFEQREKDKAQQHRNDDYLSFLVHVNDVARGLEEKERNNLHLAASEFLRIVLGTSGDTYEVQKAKDDLQTNVELLRASCATAETAEPRAALERLYQHAVKRLDELAAEAIKRDSETLVKAVLEVTSKPETTDKKSKHITDIAKILAVASETVGTHVDVSKIKTELQTTKELLEALLADKSDERHALERLYAAALKYLGQRKSSVVTDAQQHMDDLLRSLSAGVTQVASRLETEKEKEDLYSVSWKLGCLAQGIYADTDNVQKAKDDLQTKVVRLRALFATAETAEPRAALEQLYEAAVKYQDERASRA